MFPFSLSSREAVGSLPTLPTDHIHRVTTQDMDKATGATGTTMAVHTGVSTPTTRDSSSSSGSGRQQPEPPRGQPTVSGRGRNPGRRRRGQDRARGGATTTTLTLATPGGVEIQEHTEIIKVLY